MAKRQQHHNRLQCCILIRAADRDPSQPDGSLPFSAEVMDVLPPINRRFDPFHPRLELQGEEL